MGRRERRNKGSRPFFHPKPRLPKPKQKGRETRRDVLDNLLALPPPSSNKMREIREMQQVGGVQFWLKKKKKKRRVTDAPSSRAPRRSPSSRVGSGAQGRRAARVLTRPATGPFSVLSSGLSSSSDGYAPPLQRPGCCLRCRCWRTAEARASAHGTQARGRAARPEAGTGRRGR